MSTLTANPQTSGGGSNVTFDGGTTSGFGVDITTAHNIGTGDGAGAADAQYGIRALHNASGFYLSRTAFTFDTSALTSGATISSAVLSLFGTSTNFVNNSSTSAVIIEYTGTANNIAAANFGSFNFTALSNAITFASLSQSAYNDFTLNASGIALISKTGVSKFGCTTELDRSITTFGSIQDNIFTFIMADNGSNQPKLVVTYTTTVAYTMAAALGTYTYTGNNAIIGRLYTMAASVGAYVLTGLDAIFNATGWSFKIKHTTVFTSKTKHTTTYSSPNKSSTNWNYKSKH